MKIATRIALLQWQANPADPANLWRLIIAWITPGMRDSAKENKTSDPYYDTNNNTAERDALDIATSRSSELPQRRGSRRRMSVDRAILIGALVIGGSILIAHFVSLSPSYQISATNSAVWRLNTLTGEATMCIPIGDASSGIHCRW